MPDVASSVAHGQGAPLVVQAFLRRTKKDRRMLVGHRDADVADYQASNLYRIPPGRPPRP
jgi:hypothetical protein